MRTGISRALGSFFAILLAVGAAHAANADESLPRVVTPETVFDFGSVDAGTVVEHAFILKNSGSAALKVERLNTACGCTAAVLDTDTIPPGGETKVKASFDTTGFQGAKVKTIRVYTNDPRQASFLLSLQGTVRSEFDLDPARLHFGDIAKGKEKTLSIDVLLGGQSTAQIQEVLSRSPYLDIESSDVNKRGKQGKRLTVTLKGSLPVGVFRERIVLKTSSDKTPIINIPVFARVHGDITIVPSSVSFGLVEGPIVKPVSEMIKLVNTAKKPLTIASVESDNPLVTAELVPLKDARASNLRVTLKEGLSGTFRATITITTDNADAEQRQLTVPVYGIISRKGS